MFLGVPCYCVLQPTDDYSLLNPIAIVVITCIGVFLPDVGELLEGEILRYVFNEVEEVELVLEAGVIYYSVRISERPSYKILSIEMYGSLISIDCSFHSVTFGFNSISLLQDALSWRTIRFITLGLVTWCHDNQYFV